MNLPKPVQQTLNSHVSSLFLMLFILFLIWLNATGRIKNVLEVFSDKSKVGKELGSFGGSQSNVTASAGSSESVFRKALRAAGFDTEGVETMIAIGKAESGLRNTATNSTAREYSVGAFQFNLKAHPDITEAQARDPYTAAKLAYAMSGGGRNYSPWTTYTSGKYRRYLNE